MKKCIDALYDSGFILHGVGDNLSAGKYSFFQSDEKLKEFFNEICIEDSNINYDLNQTVYLREAKTEIIRTEDGTVEIETKGKYLPVKQTEKIKSLNNQLLRYNKFIKDVDITWDAPEEARLLLKCDSGQSEPPLHKRALHCIF